jgi:hypothetical protein
MKTCRSLAVLGLSVALTYAQFVAVAALCPG